MTNSRVALADLEQRDDFIARHIGPSDADTQVMLQTVGADSLEALIESTVPANIRIPNSLDFRRQPYRGSSARVLTGSCFT